MTATSVLHVVTSTIDALMHGRFLSTPATAQATAQSPTPAIEMTCLRCGVAVKATCPADDDEREDLAFECHGCGTVARWV
jgi:RNase P subunit RPR2